MGGREEGEEGAAAKAWGVVLEKRGRERKRSQERSWNGMQKRGISEEPLKVRQ